MLYFSATMRRLLFLRLFFDDTAVKETIEVQIPLGHSARYVKIQQLSEGQFMELAEVEVFQSTILCLENLALKMKATQSSTYVSDGVSYGADRAVDGIRDGVFYGSGSIAHTYEQEGEKSWWQVDLGAEKKVGFVKVFPRTDFTGRLSNFKVKVLSKDMKELFETTYEGSASTEPIDVFFPNAFTGQYIVIENGSAHQEILELAEVEVYEWFIRGKPRPNGGTCTYYYECASGWCAKGTDESAPMICKKPKESWEESKCDPSYGGRDCISGTCTYLYNVFDYLCV